MQNYDMYIGFNGKATPWVTDLISELQQMFALERIKALYMPREVRIVSNRGIEPHPDELKLLQSAMNGTALVKRCWLLIPPDDNGPYYTLTAQAALAFANSIPVRVCMCDQSQKEDPHLSRFITENKGEVLSCFNRQQIVDMLLKSVRA